MVGISDAVSLLKYAWQAYWTIHLTDQVFKWLDSTTTIHISDALDNDLSLSSKYYPDYGELGYRQNWSFPQLLEVAWHEAMEEISEAYAVVDSWDPPEHVYFEIPRAGGNGPRFDLGDPISAITTLIGYLELAVNMLMEGSDVIVAIKAAILNLDPLLVGSDQWIYEDPAESGVYKVGSSCTPVQGVYLSDLACWYGLYWLIIKLKPVLKAIGRMGALAIKKFLGLLLKVTKNSANWAKNKLSRERFIHAIVTDLEDSMNDEHDVLDAKLSTIQGQMTDMLGILGLKLNL